jgi:hypothetical protein
MKARSYEKVTKRFYRTDLHKCPECQRTLKRAVTITERKVITLDGVIQVTHGGYRCKNAKCKAKGRTYRSPAADALALPRFTFGLEVVILTGQLRLGKHQTLDEAHAQISERLAPLGVSISRREVLYLFDAFCTLLRAASEVKEDKEWFAQAEKNGGMIVSIDGIQPDKGNETVYIVRDALTGRVLAAENATSSETAVMKQILAPVAELEVSVLGTISDAQESEMQALQELWPNVPHQVCQFHVLREASKPAYEEDRKIQTAMRKEMQPKVNSVRKQIKSHIQKGQKTEAEIEQLDILGDYALGIQTALNMDGTLPFKYAGLAAKEVLDDVATSLYGLEKKGGLSVPCVSRN